MGHISAPHSSFWARTSLASTPRLARDRRVRLQDGQQSPAFTPSFAFSELGFRDEVADALHNDPMGPPELHTLQLAGAQEFVHSAPTDIEHVGSAIDSNGQAIVEIDELNVTTFAHARKMATSSILKKKAPTNWCGDFSEVIFCRDRATV